MREGLGRFPYSSGERRWRVGGGWMLLVLALFSACATQAPSGRLRAWEPEPVPAPSAPREHALGYALEFLEPRSAALRPVPLASADFQRALSRLSRGEWPGTSPREAAREWLGGPRMTERDVEHLEMAGQWLLERYADRTYTFVPLSQTGPVPLTPEADAALRTKYLKWCEFRGGGDCLGLLDDGPYLRAEDRRTLALALALGPVLDETRVALAHELLDARALVALVVWSIGLYCMMWVVPEPTTKALAASLTVLLVGWLGLETLWGLMDGWSRLAEAAHVATTFEELHAAGDAFGKVLGEDAARAMILAVAALTGRTLGEVGARVKSLPGYGLAEARWQAQGGAAVLASEETLAQAVAAVEVVAVSPQGPLAVVMFKTGLGGGAVGRGGRSAATVMRHRGGNQQVELSDGQRWHLPRGKSVADIPGKDTVGDTLQEAVTRAAKEWGPDKLSDGEKGAIKRALDKGRYWLARLLEREARGRYVQTQVQRQFDFLYDFSLGKGVDVVDPSTGIRYEILSGTESNMARHGRRMANEFFRMLTF